MYVIQRNDRALFIGFVPVPNTANLMQPQFERPTPGKHMNVILYGDHTLAKKEMGAMHDKRLRVLELSRAARYGGLIATLLHLAKEPETLVMCECEAYQGGECIDCEARGLLKQIRQSSAEATGLQYRTCCMHPDCTTCAGHGGHYQINHITDNPTPR